MKTALKANTILATRDFMRSFAKIAKRPTSKKYTIMNHGKPVGIFVPYETDQLEEWWGGLEQQESAPDEPKKHITLEELRKKYSFHSGEKNLSQKIDEIVYGVKFN